MKELQLIQLCTLYRTKPHHNSTSNLKGSRKSCTGTINLPTVLELVKIYLQLTKSVRKDVHRAKKKLDSGISITKPVLPDLTSTYIQTKNYYSLKEKGLLNIYRIGLERKKKVVVT